MSTMSAIRGNRRSSRLRGRAALLAVGAVAMVIAACDPAPSKVNSSSSASVTTNRSTPGSPSATAAAMPAQQGPSSTTTLRQIGKLTGRLTPKSVVSSGFGFVIADNMIYTHDVALFHSATRTLAGRYSDGLDLAKFGVDGYPGVTQGGPVEAAWTADGKFAYVSNYVMNSPARPAVNADDHCTAGDRIGTSFIYRFSVEKMAWDQVIPVGRVPKYLTVSPDDSTLVVANWCDKSLSVIDRATARTRGVVPVGRNPRGLVVLPDNRSAYVAVMGGKEVRKVDLATGESHPVLTTDRPRHLNLSPDGKWLYVTASGSRTVFKIDTATNTVSGQVVSGAEPRSATISPDGSALYVVNYNEASVSKIDTATMKVVQRVATNAHPIGITYDRPTRTVWVACYSGSLLVFADSA